MWNAGPRLGILRRPSTCPHRCLVPEKLLTQLHHTLQTQGVLPALALLNASTDCRFTAAFELVGDLLTCRYFHDRLGEPMPAFLAEVPYADSFCQMAIRTGEFRSSNTAADSRVDYSPYQGVMLSYHAVPLQDSTLHYSGTLCHFDLQQAALSDAQFGLLRQMARMLPPYVYAEQRRGRP